MECVEFYKTPEGDVMYKHVGEPVKELTPQGREMVSQLLDLIRTRYPGAFKDLSELYTVSEPNRWVFEFKIVSRFLRCNVGEFDNMHLDIDEDGFFHFEEVRFVENAAMKALYASRRWTRSLQLVKKRSCST